MSMGFIPYFEPGCTPYLMDVSIGLIPYVPRRTMGPLTEVYSLGGSLRCTPHMYREARELARFLNVLLTKALHTSANDMQIASSGHCVPIGGQLCVPYA